MKEIVWPCDQGCSLEIMMRSPLILEVNKGTNARWTGTVTQVGNKLGWDWERGQKINLRFLWENIFGLLCFEFLPIGVNEWRDVTCQRWNPFLSIVFDMIYSSARTKVNWNGDVVVGEIIKSIRNSVWRQEIKADSNILYLTEHLPIWRVFDQTFDRSFLHILIYMLSGDHH